MDFAEKLKFLMHITQTSNKELAEELSVNRSFISLMRTGRRSGSQKSEQVKKMALFFAKRCSAKFQRQALSEMLGLKAISASMPTEILAIHLEKWLRGEPDLAGELVSGLQEQIPAAMPLSLPASAQETEFFFGEKGRREAMSRFMAEIQRTVSPRPILTVTDDNLEWLLSDYLYTKQIQSNLVEILNRGFSFCQIMPPVNYINRYVESLTFWLPMYATGQASVYYYPRLRGNLYRHSIIVVPGQCVQYSSTVGMGSSSDITMLSTNPRLVDAFTKQFEEYLALCRPALTPHRSPRDFIPCVLDLMSRQGDSIQMVSPLSLQTLPRDILEQCSRETEEPEWRLTFQTYLDNQAAFEKFLKSHVMIDMCRVADVQDIRAGKVCIASTYPSSPSYPRYTPETYVRHLKNILRLMDQYENYYFLPVRKEPEPGFNLIVSEGGLALLVRTASPVLLLEIHRQELVTACREYLLRKAEAVGYDGIRRDKIRLELKALIRELQE